QPVPLDRIVTRRDRNPPARIEPPHHHPHRRRRRQPQRNHLHAPRPQHRLHRRLAPLPARPAVAAHHHLAHLQHVRKRRNIRHDLLRGERITHNPPQPRNRNNRITHENHTPATAYRTPPHFGTHCTHTPHQRTP